MTGNKQTFAKVIKTNVFRIVKKSTKDAMTVSDADSITFDIPSLSVSPSPPTQPAPNAIIV